MPLEKGKSQSAFQHNIKAEIPYFLVATSASNCYNVSKGALWQKLKKGKMLIVKHVKRNFMFLSTGLILQNFVQDLVKIMLSIKNTFFIVKIVKNYVKLLLAGEKKRKNSVLSSVDLQRNKQKKKEEKKAGLAQIKKEGFLLLGN